MGKVTTKIFVDVLNNYAYFEGFLLSLNVKLDELNALGVKSLSAHNLVHITSVLKTINHARIVSCETSAENVFDKTIMLLEPFLNKKVKVNNSNQNVCVKEFYVVLQSMMKNYSSLILKKIASANYFEKENVMKNQLPVLMIEEALKREYSIANVFNNPIIIDTNEEMIVNLIQMFDLKIPKLSLNFTNRGFLKGSDSLILPIVLLTSYDDVFFHKMLSNKEFVTLFEKEFVRFNLSMKNLFGADFDIPVKFKMGYELIELVNGLKNVDCKKVIKI